MAFKPSRSQRQKALEDLQAAAKRWVVQNDVIQSEFQAFIDGLPDGQARNKQVGQQDLALNLLMSMR